MLTTQRCEDAILHAMGVESLAPEISTKEIVDRAGRWLCGFPWSWLERQGIVGTTASQEYVDLGAALPDVRQVISAQFVAGMYRWLEASDMGAIIDLRAYSQGPPPYPSHYAIQRRLTTFGVFTLTMELWPTPTQTVADSIRVQYRAGFQLPLGAADSARIAIPDDWEGLFVEACIAYAQGYEERDVADPADRLGKLRESHLFQNLMRQDGMTQSNFGQMRGGAVAMQGTSWPVRRWPTSVQNP